MKIMFIHHSGLIGGAGVSLINTIKALEKDGHEIVLCLPPDPNDMVLLSEEHGIHPIICERRIGAMTYVSGIDGIFSLRFWYRIALIVRQYRKWNQRINHINPDVVIVNSKILCWMSLLHSVRKRKSVCFVRETMKGEKKNLVNRVISKYLEHFSKVVFLSEYDKELEQLKVADTAVIHNYVSDMRERTQEELIEQEKKWNLTPGSFRILYVGGVSKMKGFHMAVLTTLFMGKDVDLIVAGSSYEDAEDIGNAEAVQFARQMKAYIEEKDCLHQIHVIGKQRDMSLCYKACDVLMFPMQSPHQARPVFEAGYYGKPVVISDFENIREFVKDGYNGFTATATSIEDFAEKLMRLKRDVLLRKKMGENNRINTKEKHSKDVIQNQIKEMIREL